MAATFLTVESQNLTDEQKASARKNIGITSADGDADLTDYATEDWVQQGYQPKGSYLTEIPDGYATEEFVENKIAEAELEGGDVDLSGYATEEFVKNKIAEAEFGGEEVDLSGYAQKSELPTKISQLENDSGYATEQWVRQGYQPKGSYLTEVPAGYAKTTDIPTKPEDIGAQPAGNYLTEVPSGYATEDFVEEKLAQAEADTLHVTLDMNTSSHSVSEIKAAMDEGKLVLATFFGTVLHFNGFDEDGKVARFETYGFNAYGNNILTFSVREGKTCSFTQNSTPNVFNVTVEEGLASNTPGEIQSWSNSGAFVVLRYNGDCYTLQNVGEDAAVFVRVSGSTGWDDCNHIYTVAIHNDRTVSTGNSYGFFVPVPAKDDQNKVLGTTEEGLGWVAPPAEGVLSVTVDPATNLASHTPAQILEAAHSGKIVQLYHQSGNEAAILPLFHATQSEAVFSATGYGGYNKGYYTRTFEAFVRSDRTVDLVNDGFFDSRCVPNFEEADVGRVLTVAEKGLQWMDPPAGGGSGIPVIDTRTLGFPEVTGPGYDQTVTISQSTYNTLKAMLEAGFVKLTMAAMGGVISMGLNTAVVELPSMTQYLATGYGEGNVLYRFEIGGENGTYGARFTLT